MSFPPFPPGFPQPNVPPLPHRFPIPLGGLPVPLPVSLPMGVTVPAGVASISAPPIRNQNAAVIAAPPVISMSAPPSALLYPPQTNSLLGKPPDRDKKVNITTVFVGNITDRASDMLIRQLLSKCGTVHNWKRIQGPDGKLQAFGFCDYADPESAMRAIRLLHEFPISDKKLIVRVDAKTQEKLDEFCKNKTSENSQTKNKENDDLLEEEDKIIKGQLLIVLKEHEIELSKEPDIKTSKRFTKDKDVKNENLSELDMEDDKRNLIHREIDKFRDTYKKYDEEKEEEKRKKEEEKERKRSERKSHSRRSRSRDRDRDDRSRRSRKSRDRDRRSNRDRRSSSFEDDHLERDRERSESPVDGEELLLRRRRQEQNREREQSYQRRLREWETREKRKAKEYHRDDQKEIRRKEEEEMEKQKLKQFLQDYDDYKHDEKFYSGKALYNRQMERRKEIEQDDYEREQERKELEELRKKLNQEGHPDPESEVRKHFNIEAPSNEMDRIKMLMDEAKSNNLFTMDDDSQSSMSNIGLSVKTFGFAGMKISGGQNLENAYISNGSTPNASNREVVNENLDVSAKHQQQPNNKDSKRKKLTVSEVFGAHEDDDMNSLAKKRRPPPNALLEDSNTDSNLSTNSAKPNSQLSLEEKKIQIKNLIDKIPTSKSELFAYVLDWDLLDNNLMERRIRPWIGKKIRDYIGEEEETLLDFICKKLMDKSPAQSLLEEMAMVLDDEAQVFVVKLWRLLIYEIEAKKLGLTKY